MIRSLLFETLLSLREMPCDHGTRAAGLIWGRDRSTIITLEVGEFTPDLTESASVYKLQDVSQISSDSPTLRPASARGSQLVYLAPCRGLIV